MKTEITDLFGIKYPIIQGGMAWVSEANLAAAVSNAGGLGVIATGNHHRRWLHEQIYVIRNLTDKPFGVNISMLGKFVEDVAEVVVEDRVPIVFTGAGSPKKYIEYWKNAGIKVVPVISNCNMAEKMEAYGADAVVAEGCEAGGHIGKMTTMSLVPQVCDAVNIPVIAAGGIVDGRGMAAAMMLGASGVQMGTRFICTNECYAHDDYKRAIIDARDVDTVVTGELIGRAIRSIKNPMTDRYLEMEKDGVDIDEIEELTLSSLQKAACDGNVIYGSIMASQSSGIIKDVVTCEELINRIMKEYNALVK